MRNPVTTASPTARRRPLRFRSLVLLATATALGQGAEPANPTSPAWEVRRVEDHALELTAAGRPVLRYVYRDPAIRRPYFAHAHTPQGIRVTRNHPPVEGVDPADHSDMHPGIWLAFGDLNRHDFWRNRAEVRHEKFLEEPVAGADGIAFSVRNSYLAGDTAVCREESAFRLTHEGNAFVLQWDCQFFAETGQLVFGDQEEMGLGVRVATPLTVRSGGQIRDADGRVNEEQIWGKPSAWCAYSGQVDGRDVGIALIPHPENARPCRFHARDYGLLVANPFALKAFGEPASDPVRVHAGESLRLRFRIVLHDGGFGPP